MSPSIIPDPPLTGTGSLPDPPPLPPTPYPRDPLPPHLTTTMTTSRNYPQPDPLRQHRKLARLTHTVAAARRVGRKVGPRCLRCEVRGLPCSLERARSRYGVACVGCRRNRCAWCIQVVVPGQKVGWAAPGGGDGGQDMENHENHEKKEEEEEEDRSDPPRYPFFTVDHPKKKGKKIHLYVRDEGARGHSREVEALARELLEGSDGRRPDVWGVGLESGGAAALPCWREALGQERAARREEYRLFLDDDDDGEDAILGRKDSVGQQQQQQGEDGDEQHPDWKDYFRMMRFLRREEGGLAPRETPIDPPVDLTEAGIIFCWCWAMVLSPESLLCMRERVLKTMEECVEMHHSPNVTETADRLLPHAREMLVKLFRLVRSFRFLLVFLVVGVSVWVLVLVDGSFITSTPRPKPGYPSMLAARGDSEGPLC